MKRMFIFLLLGIFLILISGCFSRSKAIDSASPSATSVISTTTPSVLPANPTLQPVSSPPSTPTVTCPQADIPQNTIVSTDTDAVTNSVLISWVDYAHSLNDPKKQISIPPNAVGCSNDIQSLVDYEMEKNKLAAAGTVNNWIQSTTPAKNDQNVDDLTGIKIIFNADMDPNTLNSRNIYVVEEMHNHLVSNHLAFQYDAPSRTLSIQPLDYGSGNAVDVTITGRVTNINHEYMGKDYMFNFAVK